MKSLGVLASLLLAGTQVNAKVSVAPAGDIASGEIVRVVNVQAKLVCFVVRGTDVGDTSCVKRPVTHAVPVTMVGSIGYGVIETISDDVLKVDCVVSRSSRGASISCQ